MMDSSVSRTDVVIVGGGLAGLTAAAFAARGGRSVVLFDKAARLGGRATTDNRDGYLFNRGAHAFYPGGPGAAVLAELGITFESGSPKHLRVLLNGQLYPFPSTLGSLLQSSMLSAQDKIELGRIFAILPTLDPRTLAAMSVEQWLAQLTRRPLVRRFLAGVARTFLYSSALDLASADAVVDWLQRTSKHSVQYVHGGWQTLVDSLQQVAAGAGARIISGVRVEGIELQHGQFAGVRLRGGNVVSAATLVVATMPAEAGALLGGLAEPLSLSRVLAAEVACLDVALHELPDHRSPVVQDLDRPRFLTTQSEFAPLAPAGSALVQTFKQLILESPLTQQRTSATWRTSWTPSSPAGARRRSSASSCRAWPAPRPSPWRATVVCPADQARASPVWKASSSPATGSAPPATCPTPAWPAAAPPHGWPAKPRLTANPFRSQATRRIGVGFLVELDLDEPAVAVSSSSLKRAASTLSWSAVSASCCAWELISSTWAIISSVLGLY